MTNFCNELNKKLDDLHLLKHPFYQAWNEGKLSIDVLQNYAKEYYSHVAAFPRYISSIHTNCSDISSRQKILGNLIEEEQGDENHPELWLRFAEGLGVSREECKETGELKPTQNLVNGYFDLVRNNYEMGLGVLYAYERQTPEISESKIEGLKEHYSIKDARSLQFFEVHAKADQWHRDEISELINNIPVNKQKDVEKGALAGARLLWSFLDGILDTCVAGNKSIHAAA